MGKGLLDKIRKRCVCIGILRSGKVSPVQERGLRWRKGEEKEVS